MCAKPCSKFRCLDCKSTYCSDCKKGHDLIPTCTQHTCVEMDEDTSEAVIVDKLVFCSTHPGKVCELNCIECNQIVCFMCKAIAHQNHQVEAIEDGVKRLFPLAETRINLLAQRRSFYMQHFQNLKRIYEIHY